MSDHQAGTYVKGDSVRVVSSASAAVKAVWEGYSLAAEQSAESADYRDLQAQAKALGIKANQSAPALVEAIAVASEPGSGDPESALGQTPTIDDSGSPESVPEGLGDETFDPQS